MYSVDPTRCTGCGDCVEACPIEAIELPAEVAQIDAGVCVECGTCADACRRRAISLSLEAAAETSTAALLVEERRNTSSEPIGSVLLWATRDLLAMVLRVMRARPAPVAGTMTARTLKRGRDDAMDDQQAS